MGLEAWDRDLAVLLIVHGSRASRYCSLVYRHVFSSLYEDALRSFPQGVYQSICSCRVLRAAAVQEATTAKVVVPGY